MPLPKNLIKIVKITQISSDPTQPNILITPILNGVYRRVVVVPSSKFYNIFDEVQRNPKTKYLIYTEIGDPDIYQESDSEFEAEFNLIGKTTKARLKYVLPSTLNTRGVKAELYFESFDQ